MTTLSALLAHLPPAPDEAALFPDILAELHKSGRKLIVIDDDPTGTQTVHDVELLLDWDEQRLAEALRRPDRLFYVLTNSRSLPEAEAVQVNEQLMQQLLAASWETGRAFVVASRSDSTLRGHYPAEVFALERAWRTRNQTGFDGHLLVPMFFEGGRYTIDNVHYVASPGAGADTLVLASETPFAHDPVFGYTASSLPAWVEEKSGGYWKADQVGSLSLDVIRQGSVNAVEAYLRDVEGNRPVIVNAASYGDLAVVILALLRAEAAGKHFLYRTAASFVRLRGGVEARPLLDPGEILGSHYDDVCGGLVIVGSSVPSSSEQLEKLLALPQVDGIELPVDRVLESESSADAVSRDVGKQLDASVRANRVGVVYTSRKLIAHEERSANLAIGARISHTLVTALQEVTCRPRYILAKGGITSHDVAQKGLNARHALVLGQLFAGVPVWKLEYETAARFDGVPYIVFPGNVGGPESLAQAVSVLDAEYESGNQHKQSR